MHGIVFANLGRMRKQINRTPVRLEPLECRLLCYALSGTRWASTNISVSYMPDGTALDNGYISSMFASFNGQFSQSTWQHEFERALATWAKHAPLHFTFVSDDGSPFNSDGATQGDPRFGDIRLAARPMSSALGIGWYPGTMTAGGDVFL